MKWLWHYESIVAALIKPFSFWQRNIVYHAIAVEIISLSQIEVKGEENEKRQVRWFKHWLKSIHKTNGDLNVDSIRKGSEYHYIQYV